jgi:hypothetical protein
MGSPTAPRADRESTYHTTLFVYAITGLNQWLLTPWVRTPFALFQLLVFPPQEPFVHPKTERRFEDRDSQLALALLDGAIR